MKVYILTFAAALSLLALFGAKEAALSRARAYVHARHEVHRMHGGYEAGIGFGRDHPLPIAVRFKDVFLTSARAPNWLQ